MNFDLVRPCPKCPFRQDIDPYLRGDRAQEIATSLAGGGTFACHQTTVEIEDENGSDMIEDPNSQMCAGAMAALLKSGGANQIMRIAERTGALDIEKLAVRSEMVGSLSDFVAHHSGEKSDPEECCSVVDAECLHPAGILMGTTILPSEDKGPTTPCEDCGENFCENCGDDGRCNSCREYDEEEDE